MRLTAICLGLSLLLVGLPGRAQQPVQQTKVLNLTVQYKSLRSRVRAASLERMARRSGMLYPLVTSLERQGSQEHGTMMSLPGPRINGGGMLVLQPGQEVALHSFQVPRRGTLALWARSLVGKPIPFPQTGTFLPGQFISSEHWVIP